jgi:hypothetical protein
MAGVRALWIVLAAVVVAAPARAEEVCPPSSQTPELLPGGTMPADFAAIPDPCGSSDLMLRARGAFLIAPDMPDYFGSIIAGGMVRVRRRITPRGWLSIALDAVNYRYVNNAGLASSGASFGPPTLGYHRTLVGAERLAIAAYARALLPLDSSRRSGVETGFELGASARRLLPHRFALAGGLAVAAPVDIVAGQAHGRLEPVAAVELWLAPGPRLGIFVGGTTRFAVVPEAAFITAVPRAGARFSLGQRLWTAVLVELPVTGRDRTDLVASLFAGYVP